MALFDNYAQQSSLDEVYDGNMQIRDHWKGIIGLIEAAGIETLEKIHQEIRWHLQDNGVAYNGYNNPDDEVNRTWKLDPIPLVITEDEWSQVRAGLKQRATLFNLIFRDIYGEQKLIKENILPAEVIFSHKGYIKEAYNFGYKDNFNLYFYATDLARGPDGKLWIMNDRTHSPSGLGYTVENRLIMNIISKTLYEGIEVKRLADFLDDYKALLVQLSQSDLSKVGLLTSGPHNETFFEHAYLSSYLDISLIQGNDLLSKDNAIWLKHLGGLKSINTLIRRVDDLYCDPLELKNDSQLGVAGLLDAFRQGNVNMINPIGSSVLENIGLNPFMEPIAKYFLDEELILPQIATWWCGQKKELDFTLKHLDTLVIKKIDKTESIQTYFCESSSPDELENLKIQLLANPSHFAAQQQVSFSTTPCYVKNKIEPRNAIIRTYTVKKDAGYSVLNGGLVRVSASRESFLVSTLKASTSKDLWILGKSKESVPVSIIPDHEHVISFIKDIPTLRAENLFWLGRYLSRSIITARFIRYLIKILSSFFRSENEVSKISQSILEKSLTHLTQTYPGFLKKDFSGNKMEEIISVMIDSKRSGTLANAIMMLTNANLSVKNLLTIESWKLFDSLDKDWKNSIYKTNQSSMNMLAELDKLMINLLAYRGLVQESIFKDQGLILYEIGSKIEGAQLLISKIRSMLCVRLDKTVQNDLLEALMASCESFNAYRSQYKSSINQHDVINFMVLNPQYPKSLNYITHDLLRDLAQLPKSKNILASYEEPISKSALLLEQASTITLLDIDETSIVYNNLENLLSQISGYFIQAADELSKTYFSHYDE